jgi:dephospho-CoA kinase
MKVCGLTGGVGMGKSTAARFFSEFGAHIVETDELARRLVRPGEPALLEIQKEYGNSILAPDGRLRRDELARIVFADAAKRRKLEAILHPRIQQLWLDQIARWREENCQLAVVVIPLLFETRAECHFDKIICVACSNAAQHERLLARGWTPEQIKQRTAAQLPSEQKIERANFVIWTDGALEALAGQVRHIIANVTPVSD